MPTIRSLSAHEILDSRGTPTVQVVCSLEDGAIAQASVPSGASTGKAEAMELRDGDTSRYRGKGCRRAVQGVRTTIADAVVGRSFDTQRSLDETLIELDGTAQKSRLGANALLGVSLAFARANAALHGVPLYRHFSTFTSFSDATLPRLTINLFSGGMHAGGQVSIQDVLIVPTAADSIDEGLAVTHDIYFAAVELAHQKYGARLLTADEGGLAPPFPDTESMLDDAVSAIERANYRPGEDVHLGIDVASTHFFDNGQYRMDGEMKDGDAMIDRIHFWTEHYPLVSVEDGLAEDDWNAWPELRKRLDGKALTLGDDLLCTNPGRIQKAIRLKAADALLLKVNQIGTLSEASDALRLARKAGWSVTISARSGETEDDWLADLAVGWSGDQIKVGSIQQSERLAKYNRLLVIESETSYPVVSWPKPERQ